MSRKSKKSVYLFAKRTGSFPASGEAVDFEENSFSSKLDALKYYKDFCEYEWIRHVYDDDDDEFIRWKKVINRAIKDIEGGIEEEKVPIESIEYNFDCIISDAFTVIAFGTWESYSKKMIEYLIEDIINYLKEEGNYLEIEELQQLEKEKTNLVRLNSKLKTGKSITHKTLANYIQSFAERRFSTL
jgi:hypothetical protein